MVIKSLSKTGNHGPLAAKHATLADIAALLSDSNELFAWITLLIVLIWSPRLPENSKIVHVLLELMEKSNGELAPLLMHPLVWVCKPVSKLTTAEVQLLANLDHVVLEVLGLNGLTTHNVLPLAAVDLNPDPDHGPVLPISDKIKSKLSNVIINLVTI